LAKTEEALAITTRIGNIWGEAYSQAVRGQILGWMGEIGRAVADLSAGHEKTRQAGFIAGQILSNIFLARVLQVIGDVEGALARARAALEWASGQLPQFAGMCLGRITLCLLAQGELSAAAMAFADPQAHQEEQQIFQLYEIAIAGIELSLAQGKTDEAIDRAQRTIAHITELGSQSLLPDVYHAGAQALIAAGRRDEAADFLNEAINLARVIGMRGTLWHYLAAAATLADERGDHDAAQSLRAEAAIEIDYVAANTWPDELRAAFLEEAHAKTQREGSTQSRQDARTQS
jgi:tetratricopeptide (TPR) repeat protein